jgi:hypothetical protein
MSDIHPLALLGGVLMFLGFVWLVVGLASTPMIYVVRGKEVALKQGYHTTRNGNTVYNNTSRVVFVAPLSDGISVAIRDPEFHSWTVGDQQP